MSAIVKRIFPAATGASRLLRTAPAALSVRSYSEAAGATARDPGWSKKEKAIEDQYAHNREIEMIKKMKEELEKQHKELDARQKELEAKAKESS